MENRAVRHHWLYAGAVLVLFVVLAHLTASNPEGGVFVAVGTLVVSLFRLVLLIVGLAIGIAVCIAVMLGLYVACAWLISGELGRATGVRVRRAVAAQWRQLLPALTGARGEDAGAAREDSGVAACGLADIAGRRAADGGMARSDSLGARLDALEEQVASLTPQISALREELRQCQEALRASHGDKD